MSTEGCNADARQTAVLVATCSLYTKIKAAVVAPGCCISPTVLVAPWYRCVWLTLFTPCPFCPPFTRQAKRLPATAAQLELLPMVPLPRHRPHGKILSHPLPEPPRPTPHVQPQEINRGGACAAAPPPHPNRTRLISHQRPPPEAVDHSALVLLIVTARGITWGVLKKRHVAIEVVTVDGPCCRSRGKIAGGGSLSEAMGGGMGWWREGCWTRKTWCSVCSILGEMKGSEGRTGE